MDYVAVLLPIALILLICKSLANVCHKLGIPQVIGYLVGGLLLGLIKLIPNQPIFTSITSEGIGFIAKIGVVLIMFSAGLGTDLKQIKQTGIKSLVITLFGVVVPMGLGFILTVLYYGGFSSIGENYRLALSYGCILTATSVSVTVATLKELGKLNSPMGTAIISAAILDDIIGVVVLSVVLGLDGSGDKEVSYVVQGLQNIGINQTLGSVLSIILYFLIFVGLGILFSRYFGHFAKKYDHHRRIPIYAIAFCFIYAWFAEKVFGVADITGAFLAGLLLSTNLDRDYIDRRTDIFSALFFSPVFFANIGINISFSNIDKDFVIFGILFVLCGIAGKLIGCMLSARLCKFSWKDSASVGIGMMVRAEVALVCTDKLSSIVDSNITTFVVLLILITSLVAPILLKLINKEKKTTIPEDYQISK